MKYKKWPKKMSSLFALGLLLSNICFEEFRGRTFKLYGPQATIPQNRLLVRINSVVKFILGRGVGRTREQNRFQLNKITCFETWLTRFHTWFLLNSRNRFFLP